MSTIKLIIILLFSVFLGCSDGSYEFDYSSKIVVDGWIMNGSKPKVLLSYSAPYFSTFDSLSVRQLALTRAKVTIDDGTGEEVLVLFPSEVYFPPYVYESLANVGHSGKSYTLRIYSGDKIVVSETRIPSLPLFDSLWFVPETPNDTLGHINIRLTDRPSETEYYRVVTQRFGKDEDFKGAFVSMYSDQLFNGANTLTLPVYNGKGSNLNPDEEVFFNSKDTIRIRVLSLDYKTYDFWISANGEVNNTGNPLANSRIGIRTNIDGGLGIWAGYGQVTKTLFPKK